MLIRLASCSLAVITLTASTLIALGSDLKGSKPLFDGKTLDGWEQKGGNASYEVKDEMIVGRSKPKTPNSFLCTKRTYADFVLTYEYKCDDGLNSGVQIRSNSYDRETIINKNGKEKKISAGRVHGYQVEIDPDKPDRMWSAGIYDEGRSGWLYPGRAGGDPEAFTQQGQKIYKPEQWNSVRVECKGDHIRTWLNGEQRADFHDDTTAEGFIALQVHGIGKRTNTYTVRWRNLMIREH